MPLPDLQIPIAHAHDDGDHPGGGHCLDLLGDADLDRWRHILEQQHSAFTQLTVSARAKRGTDGADYELTRPLLFLAHHVCEVAIKVGIVATGQSRVAHEHALPTLWTEFINRGGAQHLSPDEAVWCDELVEQMHGITAGGFDGRYADARGTEKAWCCLNLDQLEASVTVLAALMLRSSTG